MLRMVCNDVEVEPVLQKVTGETLRASLCKNQAKWEMKNFDLPSNFVCNYILWRRGGGGGGGGNL